MCDLGRVELFKDPQHPIWNMGRMYELMLAQQYCDLQITFNGERCQVHSVVMAASSDYFKLNVDGNEMAMKELKIQSVNSEAMKKLIEFCYTGSIEIRESTCKDIVSVANLLQLNVVVKACCKFLKKSINTSNCVDNIELGKTYCSDLEKAAFQYAQIHFEEVVLSESFVKLEAQIIADLLMSDLNVSSEMAVLSCVKRWHSHDPANRTRHLGSILEFVKLPLLPPQVLLDEVKPMCGLEARCENLLMEAIQWRIIPNRKNQLKSFRTEPRKPLSTILVFGSWTIDTSPSVEVYDFDKKDWLTVLDLKFERRHFNAVMFNEKLLIIGGLIGSNYTDMVESLDLKSGVRTVMTPLLNSRGRSATAVLENFVYVIGGRDEVGSLNTVERWSPETGAWTSVTPMSLARNGCGATVLANEIFVVGGFSTSASVTIEAFCPGTGKWRRCAPMHVKRMWPGVAAVGGYLYAIGGRDNNTHTALKYSSVERYDSKLDKWSFVANISSVRYGVTAGVLRGNLVAVGGTIDNDALSVVEVYDSESNKWKTLAPLKMGRKVSNVISIPLNVAKEINTITV